MAEERTPKGYAEMSGELIRDTAILFGVFILLDVGLAAWEGDLYLSGLQTILLIVGDLTGSFLLAFGGMLLERWR
jgi:hypothetical protein